MKNGFKTLEDIKRYCAEEKLKIGFSENTEVYKKSHKINGFHVPNSIAVLPMEGCDSLADGSPGELTYKRYERFAEGGAGIIWFEATAVTQDGRASKQQLYITKDNLDNFKHMTDGVKEKALKSCGYAPLLLLQLTHSGRYSKPQGMPVPLMAAHNPALDKKFNIPADYKPVSDEYLKNLEDFFVKGALLAQEAGFDGVDLKASHGYLLGELLGAYTRQGEYGGDFEGRTRFTKNTAAKIRQALRRDTVLGTRLSIYDAMDYPYGFGVNKETGNPSLREPAVLLNELFGLGVRICAVTMGNPYFNPHINRPFDKGPYSAPEPPLKGVERLITLAALIKDKVPGMSFIGAGYSYLRQFAVQAGSFTLEKDNADFIGFGRQAFANPGFANDILQNGCISSNKTCIACTKCVELMRNMIPAGCVARDRKYGKLYLEHIKNNS